MWHDLVHGALGALVGNAMNASFMSLDDMNEAFMQDREVKDPRDLSSTTVAQVSTRERLAAL